MGETERKSAVPQEIFSQSITKKGEELMERHKAPQSLAANLFL